MFFFVDPSSVGSRIIPWKSCNNILLKRIKNDEMYTKVVITQVFPSDEHVYFFKSWSVCFVTSPALQHEAVDVFGAQDRAVQQHLHAI